MKSACLRANVQRRHLRSAGNALDFHHDNSNADPRARAMIGMSIEELAAASGLPVETVMALENGEFAGEPHALFDVRSTLEAHGIIFLSSGNQDEGGPGIRLRARTSSDDGIRPENLNAANDD